MITEIIAFLAFLSLVRGVRLVWIKRRYYDQKPDPRAKSIYYKKGKVGALLIHGFTSSPLDFKPMAEYLAKKNITVLAPLLKGHGTSPENLATTTGKDWYKSVEDGYHKLIKEVDYVFVIGHSAGGNLGISLAANYPVKGLISLATPVFFKRQKFLRTLFFVIGKFKLFKVKQYTEDYIKNLNPHRFVYKMIPFNVGKYVIGILNKSIKDIEKVKCPLLIMQTVNDPTTSTRSVNYLYRKSKSKKKKVVWFNKSHHLFIIDKTIMNVAFKEIYRFMRDEVTHPS